MIHLVLVDSELELVPEPLWGHPAIVRRARLRKKKPNRLILDSSFDHSAIRVKYPDEVDRRGRPDIVFHFLINALHSILNMEGHLRVYVHTRNDELIYVDPRTRIPKAYHRFIGLMEALFNNRVVPDKYNPLLRMVEGTVADLVREVGPTDVILLREGAERVNPYELPSSLGEEPMFLIGGFPHGDFLHEHPRDREISIYDKPLMAWTTANEIIASYERKLIFK